MNETADPARLGDQPAPPAIRPRVPRTVVLAAMALALHCLIAVAVVTMLSAGQVVAGYVVAQTAPVPWQVVFALLDLSSVPAYVFLLDNDGGTAALEWVGFLVVLHAVLITLVLRGTRTGQVAGNVFAAFTALTLVPVSSVPILVLLNQRSARQFFRETARWRRDPARTLGRPAWWLAVAGLVGVLTAAVVYAGERSLVASGGDARTVRYFAGAANVVVEGQALARGDVGAAVRKNARVTAGRTVQTVATAGNVAQVRDTWVVKAGSPDWTSIDELDEYRAPELAHVETVYAVDRASMGAATRHPARWGVTDHQGLILDWPAGASQTDYAGWVVDTRSPTALRYTGREGYRACRAVTTSPVPCTTFEVFRYESRLEASPITDERTLAGLPHSLPAATVSALATALLPAESARQVDAMLPGRTEQVALDYTYEETAAYRVEPTSGIVVSATRAEVRKAYLRLPGRGVAPPIVVYDVTFSMLSVRPHQPGVDAWNAIDRTRLWGTAVPAIMTVVGVGALTATAAQVVNRRRRRSGRLS